MDSGMGGEGARLLWQRERGAMRCPLCYPGRCLLCMATGRSGIWPERGLPTDYGCCGSSLGTVSASC